MTLEEAIEGPCGQAVLDRVIDDSKTTGDKGWGVTKLLSFFNLKNDTGAIKAVNGDLLLDRVRSMTAGSVSLDAGVPKYIGNLAVHGAVDYATYVISVRWDNAMSGSTQKIWSGGVSGVFYLDRSAYLFNSTPSFELKTSGTAHHTSVDLPTIVIDSLENHGSYGDAIVMLKSTTALTFTNVRAQIRRII